MTDIEYFTLFIFSILINIIIYLLCQNKDEDKLEIKRLNIIIEKQNKEINKLKNLGDYIYDNYIKKEND